MIWPLRWRLAVFLVCCRINHRVRLVPDLDIGSGVAGGEAARCAPGASH